MITEVIMPQMGADMKEGTVIRWVKTEGSDVARGEIIAEIETDKANIEIEAFGAGVFRKAIHKEGDVVPVGTVIAVIAAPDDDISKYAEGAAPAASTPPAATAPAETQAAPPTPDTSPAPVQAAAPVATAPAPASAPAPSTAGQTDGRLRVSPVAKKMAAEKGLDLTTVKGTGPDGRILRRDVEAAPVAPAPAARPEAPIYVPPAHAAGQNVIADLPSSRMRQTIARRTQQSKQEVPHYYLGVNIDMTESIALLDKLNAGREKGKITINDIVIMATAKTLAQHTKFNAFWVEDHVQTHSQINVGIAVAMEDGLVAPAIMDVYNKGLQQISLEARDVAARARSGNLRPEEYTAATFNISNAGVFGIEQIAPIITQPQVGVIGVGAAVETPVVRDGAIVVRSVMHVTLAADHRATDGADGAKFLQTLRRNLEEPGAMLL